MTNAAFERAQAAAKREIDRLQRARVEITPGGFTEGLGWINLNDVAEAATRAVLMAVRDEGFNIYHASDPKSPFPGHEAAEGFGDMIDAILAEGE